MYGSANDRWGLSLIGDVANVGLLYSNSTQSEIRNLNITIFYSRVEKSAQVSSPEADQKTFTVVVAVMASIFALLAGVVIILVVFLFWCYRQEPNSGEVQILNPGDLIEINFPHDNPEWNIPISNLESHITKLR